MRKGFILLGLFFILFFVSVVSAQEGLSPSGQSDVSVIVDGDTPTVNILSPENITYNNATSILFNFSIFDLTLDSVWYSLNSADNVSYSGEFSLGLPEGDYHLIVYANDSLNKISFSEVHFSINNSVSFCGNGFCGLEETCSSCSIDCGICPPSGGNGGNGGGGGGGGSSRSEDSILLDKELIVLSLTKGIVQTETIILTNTGDRRLSFSLHVEGLERFIGLSETSFSLSSDESKEIFMTFLAKEDEASGLYTGKITVNTPDDNDHTNIVLQVIERDFLFDIISELEDNTLSSQEQLNALITMTNIGGLGKASVLLEYFIKDFENNEIKIGQDSFEVDGVLQIKKEFYLPESLIPGEYVFYTKLAYRDRAATSANVFSLIKGKGIFRTILIVLILALALIIFLLWERKKKKKKRKKRS